KRAAHVRLGSKPVVRWSSTRIQLRPQTDICALMSTRPSLFDARNVPHFWLQLVSVVLSVIVGVLLIRHRGEGLLVLTLLLLVYFMIEGISKVIFSLTIRPFPNWGWVLASGLVGILLALYLLASLPVTAIWLLGVLLGIQLICEGAALGYLAWKVRAS